jgi:hypothetical protein
MTDRWHQLAGAMAESNLRASDKAVFRFLLDRADYGTADLPPKFTPPRQVIARKTSISPRQVTYAIAHLRRHGWLTTTGTTAPGRTLAYRLAAGVSCSCTGRVHDPRTALSPAAGDAERWQPETLTVATFGHRSVATNGGNAAGQNSCETRGTERKAVEATTVAAASGRQSRPAVTMKTSHGWPQGSIGEAANQ